MSVNISKPEISKEWEEVEINRVCFRGDDRAPSSEHYNDHQKMLATFPQAQPGAGEIFKIGFQARKPNKTPEYRSEKPTEKIGDIENDTAVCVSTDFFATPFFPLSFGGKVKAREGWTYAVYVERGYNTNMKQIFHGMNIMKQKTKVGGLWGIYQAVMGGEKPSITEKEAAEINWALFGQELAVASSIPVRNIIAAVKVINRKEVNGDGFENGVRFGLGQLVENKGGFSPASLSKKQADTYYKETIKFLKGEIKSPSRTVTPNRKDGIVKVVTSLEDNLKAESGIKSKTVEAKELSIGLKLTRSVPKIKKDISRIQRRERELAKKRADLERELEDVIDEQEQDQVAEKTEFWV